MRSLAVKLIKTTATLAIISVLAAACNSSDQTTAQGRAKNSIPLEIEIMCDLTYEVPSITNEYWTEFQKLTNTKLNIIWVPGSEYDTKLDVVLASGDIPEVIFGYSHNKPSLINAIRRGAFWDLTPFLGDFSEYPNLRDNMTPGSWNYVKVDGKIMGVPRSRSLIDSGLKMRKDWLDKLNLPVPTTVDEFKDTLLKMVNSDPDGNGKKDTIGLSMGSQPDTSLQAAFGVYRPTYDEAGGLIYSPLTPQYTELVQWLRDLYAKGGLPPEFAALNGAQQQELLRSGRAASYNYAIYRDFSWTEDLKKIQPDGEIFTMPPMKGPHGDYASNLDIGTRGALHISKKVPEAKVKEILRYLDQTASPEITNFAYYGKEGVHYHVIDGEKVFTDLGKEQINVNNLSPIAPAYTKWGKVFAPGSPKEWNEVKKLEAEPYQELGVTDPFRYLISDTWIEVWPKYDAELKNMTTKAIAGQITMDEYSKYIQKVLRDPQIKKSFQEFAKDYANRK